LRRVVVLRKRRWRAYRSVRAACSASDTLRAAAAALQKPRRDEARLAFEAAPAEAAVSETTGARYD